jgi:hypothetical protein
MRALTPWSSHGRCALRRGTCSCTVGIRFDTTHTSDKSQWIHFQIEKNRSANFAGCRLGSFTKHAVLGKQLLVTHHFFGASVHHSCVTTSTPLITITSGALPSASLVWVLRGGASHSAQILFYLKSGTISIYEIFFYDFFRIISDLHLAAPHLGGDGRRACRTSRRSWRLSQRHWWWWRSSLRQCNGRVRARWRQRQGCRRVKSEG